MEIEKLRQIVELMEEHGLTHFDMSEDGFRLKLKKGADLDSLQELLRAMPTPVAAPVSAPAAAAAASVAAEPTTVVDGEAITSPMVGTFYRRPSPDADNFINVGDSVSVGQTLCIIEAMKVMNEIKAEQSGVITAILAEDGSPIQYGDTLFTIR